MATLKEVFAAVLRGDTIALQHAAPDALRGADENGMTPLHLAAAEGRRDVVQALLQHGVDIHAEDAGGRTAFLVAAAEGQAGVIEELLAADPQVYDAISKVGNTALHRAAAYGHPAIVSRLLDLGLEVDLLNDNEETPLARACRWGHAAVAEVLLARGADPAALDNLKRSPMDWASSKGHTAVVVVLNAALQRALDKQASTGAGAAGADASLAATSVRGGGVSSAASVASGYPDSSSSSGPSPLRVEGWMAKQGHIIRNWKNRWFVLEGRRVFYFAREGAPKAKGVINMVDGTSVVIEEKYSKPFCFTIATPAKRFVLQAADDAEMEEWIMALENNLTCTKFDNAGASKFVVDGDDD